MDGFSVCGKAVELFAGSHGRAKIWSCREALQQTRSGDDLRVHPLRRRPAGFGTEARTEETAILVCCGDGNSDSAGGDG